MTIRTSARVLIALAALVTVALATTAAVRYARDDSRRDYLASTGWPNDGQAAWSIGDGQVQASPAQQSVPIASLAKVMTAYVVLQHYPDPARFTITVTRGDVDDTARRAARDESLVPVRAGERIDGRQALAALLLPSANNIAIMLARRVSGAVTTFVAEMNRTAHSIGMWHTTYTDPSGYTPSTRSTAGDQVLLARAAMRLPALRALVRLASYSIPVAGTVHNTDSLLGTDGFAGIKTGSMDASGGCYMFLTHRRLGTNDAELYGVVLGQHGTNALTAGLYAGKQLADRVSTALRTG